MEKITNVEVYLDDNMPEYMDGVYRIGNIITYDSNSKPFPYPKDLINNKEFFGSNEEVELEMRTYVAKELNVPIDLVEVIR